MNNLPDAYRQLAKQTQDNAEVLGDTMQRQRMLAMADMLRATAHSLEREIETINRKDAVAA